MGGFHFEKPGFLRSGGRIRIPSCPAAIVAVTGPSLAENGSYSFDRLSGGAGTGYPRTNHFRAASHARAAAV